MQLHAATFTTPCGPFSVAVNAGGAVVATAFGELTALPARLAVTVQLIPDSLHLSAAVQLQVAEYFTGQRSTFTVPMAAQGTAFQHRVWAGLAAIPFGETRSYGQLAAELGQASAARAIGRANATNPLVLLVPCHRVIGADGLLGGFAFGTDIKHQLLAHEGALLLRWR